CSDAVGAVVVSPHVAAVALPPGDGAWPVAVAPLRLAAAGLSLGAARSLCMGLLAAPRALLPRENRVQHHAFSFSAAIPLGRKRHGSNHGGGHPPDEPDDPAYSAQIPEQSGSVDRPGTHCGIYRRRGATTPLSRAALSRTRCLISKGQRLGRHKNDRSYY